MKSSKKFIAVLLLALSSAPAFAIGTWPTPEYPALIRYILFLFAG